MNRPASDPQGFGHKTDSPIPKGAGFCRGPAPPRPLVEQRGQSSIFVSNEFHLFFPRHAASLPAASCLFKLFFLRALVLLRPEQDRERQLRTRPALLSCLCSQSGLDTRVSDRAE